MADYKVTDTELTNIANAIRTKTGKSGQIEFPSEFISEIGSISGGGGGDYYRVRYYNNDGSILYSTEYVQINSHPSRIGSWSSSPNGDTPIDLSTISTSTDLYIIVPDNYFASNDGTLGVLVFDNYNVWFFNGYSKGINDASLPSELSQYTLPSEVTQAKGYSNSDSESWVANVGFYSRTIRTWVTSNASTTSVNNVYAVVEDPIQSGTQTQSIAGAACQTTEYQTPMEYIGSHTNV